MWMCERQIRKFANAQSRFCEDVRKANTQIRKVAFMWTCERQIRKFAKLLLCGCVKGKSANQQIRKVAFLWMCESIRPTNRILIPLKECLRGMEHKVQDHDETSQVFKT